MIERWQCNCGSFYPKYELVDARGIFCTYVCEMCEPEKRKQFRTEIFEDANYDHDEPIEEDDGYEGDYEDEETMRHRMFQDPGGRSSLRAESASNPRNLPCPTCGEPNRLTPADRRLGYQCNACADRDEGGW
jgi:hypothetical protein